MTAIKDAKERIKTALSGNGYIVYDYVPADPTPPCAIMVPASPWLVPVSIGSNPTCVVSYKLTLCVAANDNKASLYNIEDLAESVLTQLPSGTGVGDFSPPRPTSIGSAELVTTDVQIDVKA